MTKQLERDYPQYTGKQIRALRTSFNLTQKEFGEYCGITANEVSRWETAKVKTIIPTRLLFDLLKKHGLEIIVLNKLANDEDFQKQVKQSLADQADQFDENDSDW